MMPRGRSAHMSSDSNCQSLVDFGGGRSATFGVVVFKGSYGQLGVRSATFGVVVFKGSHGQWEVDLPI